MNRWEASLIARAWPLLMLLTLLSAAVYATLLGLGPRYAYGVAPAERPLLLVIALYAIAFSFYWVAWWLAARVQQGRRLFWWILGTSILWRLVLLPTPPFQEIDIYRYLWDGRVASLGWDPYRYPPEQVIAAIDNSRQGGELSEPGPLPKMVIIATELQPEWETILRRIHYEELPSPYPPVSQAVFAMAAATSPARSVEGKLIWLKLWLTGFDLATLLLVFWLLRMTSLPLGHAVAYGWCPLVLKEIAGSGHLDSIATFFTVLSVSLTIRGISDNSEVIRRATLGGASLSLALGVGAKLFPVVLAPLLVLAWWRSRGWQAAILCGTIFIAASALFLSPMLVGNAPRQPPGQESLPTPPDVVEAASKTTGLEAFLSRWEINDLAFALVVENLRPQSQTPSERRAWFAVVPDSVSSQLLTLWKRMLGRFDAGAGEMSDDQASFLLARMVTLSVFGIVAVAVAWRGTRPGAQGSDFARAAFLTLAWFWLLAPTQNPWYWCWAVPLLPFMRSRAWGALAACCLLYYSWFWLRATYPDPPQGAATVLGTPYHGNHFFYFVVPWFEFGPWLMLLTLETTMRARNDPTRNS